MTKWNLYNLSQLVIIILVIYFTQDNTSWSGHFITIISADSLFSAFNFLLQQDEAGTQDNSRNSREAELQNLRFRDKYIFYILLSMVASVGNFLTWNYFSSVYTMGILILTCPTVQANLLTMAQVQDSIKFLHASENKVGQHFICYIMSRIINSLAKINLQADPQISHSELLKQIDFQHSEYICKFLKIFLVNTVVKILGQDNSLKTRLLKYLYQGGHIIEIPDNHGSILPANSNLLPKHMLRLVIYHRRWQYLYEPKVLNSFIELYQSNQESYFQECFNLFWDNMRLRSLKYCTIWTICSIMGKVSLYPPMTILVECRSDVFTLQYSQIIAKLLGILAYYSGMNYLLAAVISEYISLLDNQLSRFLWQGLHKRRQLLLDYMRHENSYNYTIMATSLFLMLNSQLMALAGNYVLLGYVTIALSSYLYNAANFCVYKWLVILGWFSSYNWLHMLSLSVLLYLLINITDYRQVPIPQIEINLYHSYYQQTKAPQKIALIK